MDVRLHPYEADRLTSLRSYQLLDTAPDGSFDAVTRLAAGRCEGPASVVSLLDADRQWFLSRYGVTGTARPRHLSVCSDVVAAGAQLVITNLIALPRCAELPAVAGPDGFRGYAGMPIVGRDGPPRGTLPPVASGLGDLVRKAERVAGRVDQHPPPLR